MKDTHCNTKEEINRDVGTWEGGQGIAEPIKLSI